MEDTHTIHVALTPDLEALIDEQLAQGRLRTPVQVVREALLLLKEREELGTPPPQQVRLAGCLDAAHCEDLLQAHGFELVLESGEKIQSGGSGLESAKLRSLLGEKVLVSGLGFFRPDGQLDRIDVEHVEPAPDDVSLWSRPPRSIFAPFDTPALERPQDPSQMQKILGSWPGDESDEEVFAALEELS